MLWPPVFIEEQLAAQTSPQHVAHLFVLDSLTNSGYNQRAIIPFYPGENIR